MRSLAGGRHCHGLAYESQREPPCTSLPACSVVRPTNTNGAAMGALKFLTAMGLFIGQSDAFFTFLTDLAAAADAAQREC